MIYVQSMPHFCYSLTVLFQIAVHFFRSNVLWEEQRHKRWKSMSNRLSSALEDGYQRVKNQQSISPHANGKTTISDLEVIMPDDIEINDVFMID